MMSRNGEGLDLAFREKEDNLSCRCKLELILQLLGDLKYSSWLEKEELSLDLLTREELVTRSNVRPDV